MGEFESIVIEEQIITCRIGETIEERKNPQSISISTEVRLRTPFSQIAAERSLNHSICYATLAARFDQLARSREWVLVEELAEALVSLTFEEFPVSRTVSLLIKKFVVPDTAWVGIRMHRVRA